MFFFKIIFLVLGKSFYNKLCYYILYGYIIIYNVLVMLFVLQKICVKINKNLRWLFIVRNMCVKFLYFYFVYFKGLNKFKRIMNDLIYYE